MQFVRISKHNALAAAFDQTLHLPGTQDAAHRVQCRSGHLRDVLPTDGKVDLHPGVDLAPGLLHQTKQRMGHPLFNLFVGNLDDAGLRILQAAADSLQSAGSQGRKFGNESVPRGGRPSERDAIDGGDRTRRIVLKAHCLRHTEEFAGGNVAHYGLLTLRRSLLHTQVAVQQHEETVGLGPLIEDRRSLGISDRARFAQEFVLLGRCKSREHCQVCDQGAVDRGHFKSLFEAGKHHPPVSASNNVDDTDTAGKRRNVALAQIRAGQNRISAFGTPRSSGIPFKKGRYVKKLAILAAASLTLVATARAAEVEVKLLNKGSDGAVMVFEPALVRVSPGDRVKFVSTEKGHNAESVKGMLPEGAAIFVGKIGEDIAVKFDKEGIYGVNCLPHYGMGMVAMIVVGTPSNLDQAKAVPQVGKAKQVFATLFDKLEASKTASK